MAMIFEKILNAENKNAYWVSGGPASSFRILGDGKYEFSDFQAFANASAQNPLFFSNNIEYAAQYASEPGMYIGLVKVKDLKNLNLLDLTDPKEMAGLFPECADSPLFSEIFKKGESYYTLNWGKILHGRESVRPAEFLIARLLIIYRVLGRQKFIKDFTVYSDKLEIYRGTRHNTKKETAMITRYYPTVKQSEISKWGLDRLILDDSVKDDDLYSGDIQQDEYRDLYNAYCEAVFKPCIAVDENGNFVKDENGMYVLTRYKDMFKPRKNENPDRPTSRDATVGLSKSGGKISQKALQWAMPPELSGESAKLVNLYMKLARQMRIWYRKAAEEKNSTLSETFAKISEIVNNDNGLSGLNKKAVKSGAYEFKPGDAASFIDNLQYMFYYIVKQHANKYDGCWAPEAIGMERRKLTSIDKTILLWNAENIEVVDYVESERIMSLISAMRAGELGADSDFTGREYDDDSLLRLFAKAKGMPPAALKKQKAPPAKRKPEIRRAGPQKNVVLGHYLPDLAEIIYDGSLSHGEKREKLRKYQLVLYSTAYLHTKAKSYKKDDRREKALENAKAICRIRIKFESIWIRIESLNAKIKEMAIFSPATHGDRSKLTQKQEITGKKVSVIFGEIEKLKHENTASIISLDELNALGAAASAAGKKLDDMLQRKNREFQEFGIVGKYRIELADILQASYADDKEKLKALKRFKDKVKQAKIWTKNVQHDTPQFEKIDNFIKNELNAEIVNAGGSTVGLTLQDYRKRFDNIMRSSGPPSEKRERLIKLRNVARNHFQNHKLAGDAEKAEEYRAFMRDDIAPAIKRIIKDMRSRLAESRNAKTRLFDCPMFGVDAVKKYDYETDSYQTAYLLDDDEYALAVVRDRSTDMYLMASQYRFGAERHMLEFIGGGVEPGERPEDAILREIREEAGIIPDPSDVVMLSETTMNPSVSGSKLYLFYVEIDGRTALSENDEHEHVSLHWLTYAQVSAFFAKGDSSAPSKLLWMEYNGKMRPSPEIDIREYGDGASDVIVFCDCDGVLIRNDVNNLENPDEYYYDDEMMDCLLEFVRETGAKVVITSAWRETPDDGTARYFGIDWPNPLPAVRAALGDAYAGDAPSGMNKAAAVHKWIDDRGFTGNFVILDDEDGDFAGTDLEDRLVLTDPVKGFTRKDAARAADVLQFLP